MSMVLQTNGLTKRYGKQLAVNKVNLNVEKGDIYGLIGKNGAGKTTIMKIACGLIYSTEGNLQLFNNNDIEMGRKKLGSVIEQPALYPRMSAKQNLIYFSKLLGIPNGQNIDDLLTMVGLHDTGKKQTRKFSLGMKQRLSIAISLLTNPEFLILDEPTNGLDPYGIKEIRELILKLNKEQQITILVSSHILGELSKIATKYGVINDGVLIGEFTTSELENRSKKSIVLQVDNIEKATYILENTIKSNDFKVVNESKISIYDCLDIPALINKTLVENGVSVSSIYVEGNDTEEYFVKLMGGEQS